MSYKETDMAWRESFEIPPVKHNAPIPMASRVGNMVFTSGIMGSDPESGQMPQTIEEQARNCFRNLENVLTKAGAKTTDVAKVTVFIKSNSNRQAVNPPWLEMFPELDADKLSKLDPAELEKARAALLKDRPEDERLDWLKEYAARSTALAARHPAAAVVKLHGP